MPDLAIKWRRCLDVVEFLPEWPRGFVLSVKRCCEAAARRNSQYRLTEKQEAKLLEIYDMYVAKHFGEGGFSDTSVTYLEQIYTDWRERKDEDGGQSDDGDAEVGA